MIDTIEVQTTEMNKDREFIKESANTIQSELEKLGEEIIHLGSDWNSPAYQALVKSLGEDIELIQDVLKMVAEFIADMNYAEEEYVKCEDGIADLIAQIKI